MLNAIAVIQARMKSERLPGKVMLEVLGRPLISFLFERMSQSKVISKLILATSSDPSNDILCEYVTGLGYEVFRGSENDVLDRFYGATLGRNADVIVRTTADSPLMDYRHVDKVIKYLVHNHLDYVSSGANSPVFPDGLDTEVFTFTALERAWKEATLKSDREHVTAYMKKTPGFRIGDFKADRDHSCDRFTLDNPEDFEVIKALIENLYRPGDYFDTADILRFKASHPALFQVNAHIQRNEGYLKSLKRD